MKSQRFLTLPLHLTLAAALAALLCITATGVADDATTMPASVAATQPDEGPLNPFLTGADDAHLDNSYEAALSAVATSLANCPPALKVSSERQDVLTMLDLLFHDPYAPKRKPVQAFHVQRAEMIADALEHTDAPTEGATIYMFYNMGFIVRTHTVTIGFDLIRAKHMGEFALSDELMKRVIDRCDATFISHVHFDHADPWVAQTFIDAHKPVIAPPDLWADQPINAQLTKLKRDSSLQQSVVLADGKRKLDVVTNPGFQDLKTGQSVTCNVYVVRTPEGLLVAHTGDNNNYKPTGLNWTDADHTPERIDVLLLNDWTALLYPKTLRGYNPRLIIAGHFDELGHANINARTPYWRGLIHAQKSVYPWLVMTWGESFNYHRAEIPPSPFNAASAPDTSALATH